MAEQRLIEAVGSFKFPIESGGCTIGEYIVPYSIQEKLVDHLIANGVTIQRWIPVTERLPEKGVLVLCIGARGGMFLGRSPNLFSDGTAYFVVPNARNCRYATHWMPLPEAPKMNGGAE